MNNKTGAPVAGDDFFGREKELDFAWQQIKSGNSLILSAPRRVGKTSVALMLLDFAEKEGWKTMQINLEEIKSEIDFVSLFIDKIEQQSWMGKLKANSRTLFDQIAGNIKAAIEIPGIKGSLEWQNKKTDTYSKLKKLIDHEENTLIMVDEVTILLNHLLGADNNIEGAEFFLNWLRSFRQIRNTKIRWVFCSSIGIDNFTQQHHLGHTFNDVNSYEIGAFDSETSDRLLIELSKSDNLEISVAERFLILDKIGWKLPFFIQLFYNKLNFAHMVEGAPISKDTINLVYQKLIAEKHLNTWDERLDGFGPMEANARIILNRLCQVTEGESRGLLENALSKMIPDESERQVVLARLLNMLKNDGYLAEDKGKYLFRSPLIRDFWFNKFIN